MHRRIRRPSPSLVISVLALFIALGGAGYAASLPEQQRRVVAAEDQRGRLDQDQPRSGHLDRDPRQERRPQGHRRQGRRPAGAGRRGRQQREDRLQGRRAHRYRRQGGREPGARRQGRQPGQAEHHVRLGREVLAGDPARTDGVSQRARPVSVQAPRRLRRRWLGQRHHDRSARDRSFITGSRPYPPSATGDTQNAWEIYGNDNSPGARRLMAIAVCVATS